MAPSARRQSLLFIGFSPRFCRQLLSAHLLTVIL
jgi:hypothetical protein